MFKYNAVFSDWIVTSYARVNRIIIWIKECIFLQDKRGDQINFREAKIIWIFSLLQLLRKIYFASLVAQMVKKNILKISKEHKWHLINPVTHKIKDIDVVI